jgi:hypothetical protein
VFAVGLAAPALYRSDVQHRATKVTETHRENGLEPTAVLNERRGLTPVVASQIAETLQAAVRPAFGLMIHHMVWKPDDTRRARVAGLQAGRDEDP